MGFKNLILQEEKVIEIKVLFDRLVTADGKAETMYSAGEN